MPTFEIIATAYDYGAARNLDEVVGKVDADTEANALGKFRGQVRKKYGKHTFDSGRFMANLSAKRLED
jgi:hypothetical protein